MSATPDNLNSQDGSPDPVVASTADHSAGVSDGRPQALIVLGMHRSGTSVLTRVLSLMGADLPSKLLEPNYGNVTGYWESEELSLLQEELLQSAKLGWDRSASLPASWYQTPEAKEFHRRVIEVLRRDFSGSRMFVLKDPRNSLLVPFWLGLLAEFGADPVFIISVRDPIEVAGSLTKRNEFLPQKSMLLWLRYMLDAQQATNGLRRCYVAYQDLLADWRGTVAEVAKKTALAWPRSADEAAAEMDALVTDDHRHQRAEPGMLDTDPAINNWVRDAYTVALAAARGDESRLIETNARITAELDTAAVLYEPLMAEHHASTWKAWHLQREIDANAVTAAVAAQTAAEQNQALTLQLQAATGEFQTAAAKVDEQHQALQRYREALREREAEYLRLRDEFAKQQSRLGKLTEHLREQSKAPAVDYRVLTEQLRLERDAAVALQKSSQNDGPLAPAEIIRVQEVRVNNLQARLTHAAYQTWQRAIGHRVRSPLDPVEIDRNAIWLFNEAYYLEMNPDVAADGMDPLTHFLRHGWQEGRSPHPFFDLPFYLETNADVAAAGVNPLIHFLEHGCKEARNPNRLFDVEFYSAANPDVATAGVNPIRHYLDFGGKEGRNPGPLFEGKNYADFNPEYIELGVDPLSHYLWRGIDEGLSPLPVSQLTVPLLSGRSLFAKGAGLESLDDLESSLSDELAVAKEI